MANVCDFGGGGDNGVAWKKNVAVGVDLDDKEEGSRRHRTPSTKKAIVEVTVKVKKRRSSPSKQGKGGGDKAKVDNVYPRGSWGDLLARNTNKELDPEEREHVLTKRTPKSPEHKIRTRTPPEKEKMSCCDPLGGGGDRHHSKNVCNKIPITSDLYLETHAHIKSKSGKDVITDEYCRREAVREKEVRSPTFDFLDFHRENKKKNGSTLSSDSLRIENEALRSEAAGLLDQMRKAKQEQLESIMTIRELYQLAEVLKRENQKLIGAQEEHQLLQRKLVTAVAENDELKGYLDTLMKQQTQPQTSLVKKDDKTMMKLEKIRSVIEEVKSTIQEEIKVIAHPGSTLRSGSGSDLFAERERHRAAANPTDSDVLSEAHASEIKQILGSYQNDPQTSESQSQPGDSILDDTNATEIQRIVGRYDDSRASILRSLDNLEGIKGYLSPPPPARFD